MQPSRAAIPSNKYLGNPASGSATKDVRMAARRSKVRPACRIAPLLAATVVMLAGCTAGAAAGHGRSASEMSSASDVGSAVAPSPSSSTSSTARTSPSSTTTSTAPVRTRTSATTASGRTSGTLTAASSGSAIPKAIQGTTWLLVRAAVGGKKYDSPQPAGSSVYSSYTMQFVDGELLANDGCNTLQVGVTVDTDTVTSSTDVTSTAVACRTSALREAYDGDLFRVSVRWSVSGGELTLTAAGGDTFKFEPLPRAAPATSRG